MGSDEKWSVPLRPVPVKGVMEGETPLKPPRRMWYHGSRGLSPSRKKVPPALAVPRNFHRGKEV